MAYPTEPRVRASGTVDTATIPLVKSESDGAYTKVRRKVTRVKNKFTLSYQKITYDEFDILKAYFYANQGLSFDFIHPSNAETFTCVFAQEEIQKTYIDSVLVSTTIVLEEV